MRKWTCSDSAGGASRHAQLLAGLIQQLGQPRFRSLLLESLQPLVPAASFSVYRTGHPSVPQLYLSGSLGVPDTTQDCWRAYLSGPHLHDRTLIGETVQEAQSMLCHLTAREVPAEHRARVYEAHGVAERVSVVRARDDGLFAVNFYRHQHQRPFSDAQVADFEALAPALMALACKHVDLAGPPVAAEESVALEAQRLRALQPALTPRELEVCVRLLRGMTYDGIASDLGLSVPSVKTYRNRAFDRLGIHFRNELYALVLHPQARLQ
ncbi:LuxR family transcriptional regulator [Hylemonella gracilis]|jgi:DNA-binding CsgD family transcriptional regulator|uniref:LuxR family transcriptional regulator n=1 Tax=Hylemonella gracilis TaxID=80880 RepID=A0A4P6UFC3_9BURK|nr:helix-turn-helix transcriptional regulator [Hylemonella gracilis]QBK03888.1 LuxR family transcriptional regulator [Hylemonella gracilis]